MRSFFSAGDEDSRRRIISLAGKLKSPKCTGLLARGINDSSADVRATASYYLCQRSVDVDLLKKVVKDADPRIRLSALTALTRKQLATKQEIIAPLLNDPDKVVRFQAIYSLSDPKVLKSLLQKFSHKPESEKLLIATIITGLQNSEQYFFPYIEKLLDKKSLSEYQRGELIYGLAEISSPQSAALIIKNLCSSSLFIRNVSVAALLHMAARAGLPRPRSKTKQDWGQWLQENREKLKLSTSFSKVSERETPLYIIKSDKGIKFLQNTVVLMEYINMHYQQIFSARPLSEYIPEQALKDYPEVKILPENTYELPTGEKIKFSEQNKRTIYYPHGKIVTLEPGAVKKIQTPNGKIITLPHGNIDRQVTIRIFKNRHRFQDYARVNDGKWPFLQDAGAYYSPERAEIIAYSSEKPFFIFRTLIHEAFHHVLTQHIFQCPIWFNEGMAEYFDNYRWTPEGPQPGLLDTKHLYIVKKLIQEGAYLPIEYLIQLDHFSFHNDNFGPHEISNYAQSWSLIYFLYNAKNGHYRDIITEYIVALQDGEDPHLSFLRILESNGLSCETLEQLWLAYYTEQ